MRSCGIARELPAACEGVSASALAQAMKSAVNLGISRNAAFPVEVQDLDEIAMSVMSLSTTAAV